MDLSADPSCRSMSRPPLNGLRERILEVLKRWREPEAIGVDRDRPSARVDWSILVALRAG